MDAFALLPTAVSALTTIGIAVLKDRSVRTIENRTKRVEFWKTMLDGAAALNGETDVSFIKEQYKQEVAEAVAAEDNKFVGTVSIFLILIIELLVISLIGQFSIETLHKLKKQGVPPGQSRSIWICIGNRAGGCLCRGVVLGPPAHKALALEQNKTGSAF